MNMKFWKHFGEELNSEKLQRKKKTKTKTSYQRQVLK